MNLYRSSFLVLLVTVLLMLSFSPASSAQVAVGISVRIGPPALPVYAQPLCPGPGYFWTPGYWAWDDDDGYYWVPGTWVLAPVGMLWTPGYWGWNDGLYAWNGGYWGPHIGFYGGINYGFGYTGVGFFGGEWRGDTFFYNRSVTNVNVTSGFQNGWAQLTFNGVGSSTNGMAGGTGDRAPVGSDVAVIVPAGVVATTFFGLPVTGFMIRTFRNNVPLACAAGSTQLCANAYSSLFNHAYHNRIAP